MHGSQPNVCFIGLSHSCIDSVASASSIMYLYAYMRRFVCRRDVFFFHAFHLLRCFVSFGHDLCVMLNVCVFVFYNVGLPCRFD